LPPISAAALPEDRERTLCALLSNRGGGLIAEHLARLGALPAHGNRVLHVDQLFLGLLLAFFDPLARSLRTIEDHGDFGGRLDLPRLARSTTADALAAFNPSCLKPIIDDLRQRVPHLSHADADLSGITRRIIASGRASPSTADGTYLSTLADVAWALHQTRRNGRKHTPKCGPTCRWTPRVGRRKL
jgi:hypothetical protein